VRLVPVVIKSLLAGQPCRLTPGTQQRDFVHVEDVADALAAIARARVDGAVNVGTSTAVPVAVVARAIARLLERPDLVQLGALPARPETPPCTVAAPGRLREVLGWRPRYDLLAGLRQTIDWWRRQAHAAEPVPGLRG
jgi:nucleoside-diphosphate-sugar epimerase